MWPVTRGWIRFTTLVGPRVDDRRPHLGLIASAAVGEGGVRVGELDRGHHRGPLPEGHLDVVAGVPGGVGERGRGLLVQELALGLAVDPARGLVRQVDAGHLVEPVAVRHVLDGGRSEPRRVVVEVVAEAVEVEVVRDRERVDEVDLAGALGLVVLERTAGAGAARVLHPFAVEGPGVVDVAAGRLISPSFSAAVAVTSLKVDPGV